MSKQIDFSDPSDLSDDDRKYLRDRGRIDVIQQLDYTARVRAAAEAAVGKSSVQEPAMEEVDEPYEKWNVEELRDELTARDLSTAGNKAELVDRLEASDRT